MIMMRTVGKRGGGRYVVSYEMGDARFLVGDRETAGQGPRRFPDLVQRDRVGEGQEECHNFVDLHVRSAGVAGRRGCDPAPGPVGCPAKQLGECGNPGMGEASNNK